MAVARNLRNRLFVTVVNLCESWCELVEDINKQKQPNLAGVLLVDVLYYSWCRDRYAANNSTGTFVWYVAYGYTRHIILVYCKQYARI